MEENDVNKKSASDFLGSLDPEAVEAVAELNAKFPDLAQRFNERLYGDLFQRGGLSQRDRHLVMVAALAAAGRPDPQLPMQIRFALKNGVSREDILEIALHIDALFGFTPAMNLASLVEPIADEIEISQTASA